MEKPRLTVFVLIYFVISRIWFSVAAGFPIGVDAWDYMTWIKRSMLSHQLQHAPLHVPGFYSFVAVIATYTGIDVLVLYTYFLPLTGAILLWKTYKPLLNMWGAIIAATYGYYVIRTSMIIPEWLGLILLPVFYLSIIKTEENGTYKIKIIQLILLATIIITHHLSGGIAVFLMIYRFLREKSITTGMVTGVGMVLAIISWFIAGSFPIKLIFLLLTYHWTIYIVLPLLLLSIIKFDALTHIERLCEEYWYQLSLPIFISLLGIAYLVDVEPIMLVFWLPAFILYPLVGKGINNVDDKHKNLLIGLTLLHLGIALFSIIRPLLARLFIFEIQLMIPVAALGMAIIFEEIKHKFGWKILLMGILLTTSFHSNPSGDYWFDTQFRYYPDEIECATTLDRWHNTSRVLDTDNRLGVMIRGHTLMNTTFGEPEVSWMTQWHLNLTDNQLQLPSGYTGIISQVYLEVGYHPGKFIHGEGGGGNQVSLEFDKQVLLLFQQYLSKVATIGQCTIWQSKI